jgi:hypothetical protein
LRARKAILLDRSRLLLSLTANYQDLTANHQDLTANYQERMEPMSNKIRITIVSICCCVCFGAASVPLARAQYKTGGAKGVLDNPSPELVGQLTKQLSITPQQAIGGSGALFGLAKSRLKPTDFTKIADVVPGMDGLLKAAPKPKSDNNPMNAMAGMLPGKAGGLASVASSFKSLGLSPEMASKFVPVMTQFVQLKGGDSVASLLGGALK